MIKKEEILKILDEYPGREKIFLVDLRISSSNKISLFADRMEGITIEECVQLSRFIEHHLDREKEDFELVVSSPGLDMPFMVREQYQKNKGKRLKIRLTGNQEVRGRLVEVKENGIVFEKEIKKGKKKKGKKSGEEEPALTEYPFEKIEQAKLIIEF
jgi:ribosome maturation factor RimP